MGQLVSGQPGRLRCWRVATGLLVGATRRNNGKKEVTEKLGAVDEAEMEDPIWEAIWEDW